MKNNKNLKTVFTGVAIVAALTTLILTLIWANISGVFQYIAEAGSRGMKGYMDTNLLWTISDDAEKLVMNWKLAGLALTCVIVTLGFIIAKFAMFTIPSKDKTALVFDIIAFVGVVLVVAGMFIPLQINPAEIEGEAGYRILRVTQALLYAGSPIALASLAVNGVVGLKAGK